MNRLASAWVVFLAVSDLALARSSDQQGPGIWMGVDRVVAVGDVHGDYDQLVAVLASAGLVDSQGNWSGGKTHLVQTGDVVDRGPASRKCLDLLMRLEKQAAEAGGMLHALIGNHEAMNMYGDLRYVPAVEFAAYLNPNTEKSPAAPSEKEHPSDRANAHPPGYEEHRRAFSVDGLYGKWIASHDAVIKINDSLYVHGGISSRYASMKIREINQRVREELKNQSRLNGGVVKDTDGPLWYRGMAQHDDSLAPLVDKVRKNFGVERVVIGHTYSNAAITPLFDGEVIMIDIGISRVYDGVGKTGCLVLENGAKPYVLHRGKRLELPSDSGKDLLRYLKEAAALDPAPSPLLKRIAELESKLEAGRG